MKYTYKIICAPTNLGLRPTGVEGLAARLLDLGLSQAIEADRGPTVGMGDYTYDHVRDEATGYLNLAGVRDHALRLSEAIARVMDEGGTPIVLGGDCSILIGATLALKPRGRYGLLFVDGHSDFYDANLSGTGEIAEMDLGIVLGFSHPVLSELGGPGPLVSPADAVAFGFRDEDCPEGPGNRDVGAFGVKTVPLPQIRAADFRLSLSDAVRHLDRPEIDGIFVHFDADVLDDEVMPAVDYRLPGGLSPEEGIEVLREVRSTGKFAGMTVSIYNPSLDQSGAAGLTMVRSIAEGLRQPRP